MATPEQMAQTMIDNLKEKTGKTLPQWLKVCAAAKLQKHGEIVKMLKADHRVTHGFANLIAHKAREGNAAPPGEDALVEAQYAGAKGELRPVYDLLIKTVRALGKDVEVAPKKSYVSLRRSKQFALIQPSTKTRVDLGLNLKNEAAGGRLEASGSFNQMVSHRVRLSSVKDVDAEVKGWLKKAYAAA